MNVFELFAKIGLDTKDFDSGLKKAGGAMSSFGSKIGSVMSTTAKITAGAMATAATAATGMVVKLTKEASSAYANYEQLVGGVNKLYGEASQKVQEYAAQAYETVGISANDYMETATSFSAALINSLEGDVDKAADLTDMAMRAMSDNVNTFGSSFESVQNAFMGFSKQNYTMLDNLKLGYGGTKTEMERLIADANAYAETLGMTADLSIDSFADVVQAIELVQQKQNVAGTTAKEAAGTVSGSIGAIKAAWENLVAGLANPNADIGKLIQKFTSSLTTFAKNIKPVIMQALKGVGTLIKELAPEIAKAIPELAQEIIPELSATIQELAPILIEGAMSIIMAIANELPTLLPVILEAGVNLFTQLINALDQVIEMLVPMLPDIIDTIVNTLTENMPTLLEGGMQLLMGLLQGIADNAEKIVDCVLDMIPIFIDTITDNLPQILEAGGKILYAILTGIGDHLPEIVGSVAELIGALIYEIVTHLPEILDAGADILGSLANGIVKTFEPISDALSDVMIQFTDWVSDLWGSALEWGSDLIDNFVEGIKNAAGAVWDTLEDIGEGIADLIGFSEPEKGPLSNFHTFAPDMMELFAKGITDNAKLIDSAMQDVTGQIQKDWSVDVSTNAQNAAGGSTGGSTRTIVLQLADNWGRIVAEGTADIVSILQGESVMLGERGLAT